MIRNGLYSNFDYPYTNQYSAIPLQLEPPSNVTKTNGFLEIEQIPSGDCDELLQALQKKPILVTLALEFQTTFYSQGILPSNSSGDINLNAVLVGYHEWHGYLIKNSWGPSWGYDGYAWIQKYSFDICENAITIYTEYEK